MYARPLFIIPFRGLGGLSSEVIETDVGIVDAQRVEQVEDGLRHHRRTAALALRLGTIRDCLAHGISRLALRFPHRVHYVSARRGPR